MNRIKEARKAKKISQKKLAELIGTTQQAISLYENDKREPNENSYSKLSKILDSSIDYLKGNTYSKKELLTVFNNSYLDKNSMLRPKIIYYLDFINAIKPEQLFTAEQLEELTDSVKDYWLKYFSFIFDANYKKAFGVEHPENFTIDFDTISRYKLTFEFMIKIRKEIEKNSNASLINMRFNTEVKPDIKQCLNVADLITTYGTKKQVLEFNNKLVDTINSFSKSLEGLPDNPNIDAEKVEKYLD